MRKGIAVLLILTIALTSRAALAGPPAVKPSLKFDAKSDYALVVFESEPQTAMRPWVPRLYSFSLETRKWTYGPLKGWSAFEEIDNPPGSRFHAALVKPAGVYAVNRIIVQTYWNACMNGGTAAFQLEAGKVNYIGVIDPRSAFEAIAEHLPQKISGAAGGLPILVLFDIPRLHITPPSAVPDWNTALTSFLAAELPKVTAPIVAAEPIEVTFEPGKAFTGKKICEKY